MVTDILLAISSNPYIVLFIVNIILLIVGAFIDMSPAIVIFTPILLPVMRSIGIDPIHFGIIMQVNLCIGLCTPPVGSVLFVGMGIAGISIQEILKPLLTFLFPMVIVLFLITYFPILVLWFPHLLFR
jgi:TRAP-type C4-dicarboxylate transport system permease large subunit